MKVSISKNTEILKANPKNLTPGVSYVVIGLDWESFRIINDLLEPVLYSKELFEIDEPTIPSDWVEQTFDDGEYYIDPPEFSEAGFYENYFDGQSQAAKIYERYLILNGLR